MNKKMGQKGVDIDTSQILSVLKNEYRCKPSGNRIKRNNNK